VVRFVEVSGHRSLNRAAKWLGVAQPVLTSQLHQLETATGGALLLRGYDRRAAGLQVTPLGRQLLAQAEQHLGLAPPTRMQEPLASAIGSFRGDERIAKFEVLAIHPTLRSGAKAVGVTPASLRRSIRGLEDACGDLVNSLDIDAPIRLTRRGNQLLTQWRAARADGGSTLAL